MRWFRFAVLVLLATLLQAGVLANFRFKPDLLLVLLVFFSVYSNLSHAIITSFAVGFAADISVIGSAMGPHMISFGLWGTLLAYVRRLIAMDRMPYQALVIFVIGLLAGGLTHVLHLIKGASPTSNVLTALLATSLCSAAVGPFLFLPSAWWMRIRTNRFGR